VFFNSPCYETPKNAIKNKENKNKVNNYLFWGCGKCASLSSLQFSRASGIAGPLSLSLVLERLTAFLFIIKIICKSQNQGPAAPHIPAKVDVFFRYRGAENTGNTAHQARTGRPRGVPGRRSQGAPKQVVGRDGHLGDATHRANYTLTTFISRGAEEKKEKNGGTYLPTFFEIF
jgi:hypothetical protein